MPYTLVPPGRRKRGTKQENRVYYARFKVDGRDVEISTKTRDRDAAARYAALAEARFRDRTPAPAGADVTFEKAAQHYAAERKPSKAEQWRIDRVTAILKTRLVAVLDRGDLIAAADQLYPVQKAASRNRNVITPAASILHFAAEKGWAPYRKIRRETEPEAETRDVSIDSARRLIANAKGKVKLLLVVLFRQGLRISNALRIEPKAHIDLQARTMKVFVTKTGRWLTMPIHDDVFALLANEDLIAPKLFPWYNRWQVYRELAPVNKAAGVTFTPHMARHAMAAWMVDKGIDLKTVMEAGGWKDVRSVLRYAGQRVERVRKAGKKLGRIIG